jgi:hypothetical protein
MGVGRAKTAFDAGAGADADAVGCVELGAELCGTGIQKEYVAYGME